MGPDCGTAILHGTPLGFANVVRPGAIGVVGASGTGLQEVTCQIDALGQGIRTPSAPGGHDVGAEIGGSTLRQALALLADDPGTRVICVVSKTPAPWWPDAASSRSPPSTSRSSCSSSAPSPSRRCPPVVAVTTLVDAARAAAALAEDRRAEPAGDAEDGMDIAAEVRRFAPGQRDLRGLYSGGTFASEAQLIWGGLDLRPLERAGRRTCRARRAAAVTRPSTSATTSSRSAGRTR